MTKVMTATTVVEPMMAGGCVRMALVRGYNELHDEGGDWHGRD